ncbi:type II toxin-antitoxin system PemK/MazF family toxin [Candidatus Saccharibacteria bacterium]|nr:type II toxin-antitoxin system PemK/MazF family toxin [Candidatus Saccharibacteria bacterium]
MKKFNQWNEIKKMLNDNSPRIVAKEGYLYWVSVGVNVGTEEDGKGPVFTRPVLAYYADDNNKKEFLGIPFTTTPQRNEKYTEIAMVEDEITYALLKQIRVFSVKRINREIGRLKPEIFDNIIYKMTRIRPKRYYKTRKK